MVVYIQVSQILSVSFLQGIATTHLEIESYVPTHEKPLFQLSYEIKCYDSFPREKSLLHHWFPVFLRMSRNGKRAKFKYKIFLYFIKISVSI